MNSDGLNAMRAASSARKTIQSRPVTATRHGQGAANAHASSGEQQPARRRHVLHGWRLLAGPLIVQVLQNEYETPGHIPAAFALERYRKPRVGPAHAIQETI